MQVLLLFNIVSSETRVRSEALAQLDATLRTCTTFYNAVAETEGCRVLCSVRGKVWRVVRTLLLRLDELQRGSEAALVLDVLSHGGLLVISGRDRFRFVNLLRRSHRRPI